MENRTMQSVLKCERRIGADGGPDRRDILTALLVFALVLVLGLSILNRGHEWGDDFAGYILQAQALVEGDVQEMARRIAVLHPSVRSFEEGAVDDSPLVYVWGLPLVLSLVYRAVGYDAPAGEMIIYYKIPGAIFFAVFAAALFLLYRKRFSYAVSLFLAFMLVSHRQLFGEVNSVMTDIPCLAAACVSLLSAELFFDERHPGKKALLGILLGTAMWYTAVVRLNGITVVLCVLLGHGLALSGRRDTPKPLHLLPWVVFLALYAVTFMLLPMPNSNTSHMLGLTLNRIKDNLLFYDGQIASFAENMLPAWVPGRAGLHVLLYVLIAAGLMDRGLRREEFHLAVLMCSTGAALLTLPYVQGLRYMFVILPLMVLFAAYGAAAAARLAGRVLRGKRSRRAALCIAWGAVLAVSLLRVGDLAQWRIDDLKHGGREQLYDAYHPASKDIYAYIDGHVEEDAVIAYMKPRLLYLNTGRMSMAAGVNGHHFYDADYLLTLRNFEDDVGSIVWPELREELTLVYENPVYELYRISDAYRSLRYE